MLSRVIGAVFALAMVLSAAAGAFAAQAFDERAFSQAQAAGRPVVVHVTASWCPTCRQQHPVIAALEKERPDLVVLDVDFDTAKEVLRRFGVRFQSTVIVFKGPKEIARSTGETNPARLRDMIAKAY